MFKTIGKVVKPVRKSIKDLATSTVSENTLNTVGPYVPVLGSAFGVVKTCRKVYNATALTNAIVVDVKGVLIDCTLSFIKYHALCTAGTYVNGDLNYIVSTLECPNVRIK